MKAVRGPKGSNPGRARACRPPLDRREYKNLLPLAIPTSPPRLLRPTSLSTGRSEEPVPDLSGKCRRSDVGGFLLFGHLVQGAATRVEVHLVEPDGLGAFDDLPKQPQEEEDRYGDVRRDECRGIPLGREEDREALSEDDEGNAAEPPPREVGLQGRGEGEGGAV